MIFNYPLKRIKGGTDGDNFETLLMTPEYNNQVPCIINYLISVVPKLFTVPYPFRHLISSCVPRVLNRGAWPERSSARITTWWIFDVRGSLNSKYGSFAQGRKKHSSTLLITSGLNMLLYICRLSGTVMA